MKKLDCIGILDFKLYCVNTLVDLVARGLASNHRLSPLFGLNSHMGKMVKACPNNTTVVERGLKL